MPADDTSRQVSAARDGDRGALEMLLRDNYDRIYALCHRLVGNDADAADAAQDAMIAVVKGLAAFDGRSSFSTWAYRIAYNSSVDLLRRRNRHPTASLDDPSASPVDLPAPDSTGPAVARMDIGAALHELPVDFRSAVVLRDLCGLDYAEIADVLKIPAGTVRSRIARGRSMLAEAMRPARSGA